MSEGLHWFLLLAKPFYRTWLKQNTPFCSRVRSARPTGYTK